MRVGMITLGCAKNTVDTEIMLGDLQARGYRFTDQPADANVLIVNTCGFIEAAKQESIDTILEMAQWKEEGCCQALIVTGCLTQRYGAEILEEIPEVDAVLGTGTFGQLSAVIDRVLQGERVLLVADPSYDYDTVTSRLRVTPRGSAYVKIAEGCDHRCAYCAIPLIRGPYRSRSRESIVQEVSRLAAEGVQEINLIAQDTTRYGLDRYGRLELTALLQELLKIDGPAWYRLLYLYPTFFNEELLDLIARQERVLDYLDLPLQHISPRILRDMQRPDDPDSIRRLLYRVRERVSDITLRTAFIVGFPGETDDDVAMLADFMREIQFDHVGVFTYSQEEGTLAASRPDQIPEAAKEERRDFLMMEQQPISLARNRRYIGRTIEVLVEKRWPAGDGVIGRGRKDAPEVDGLVYVRGTDAAPGKIIPCDVQEAQEYDLLGVLHK